MTWEQSTLGETWRLMDDHKIMGGVSACAVNKKLRYLANRNDDTMASKDLGSFDTLDSAKRAVEKAVSGKPPTLK